MLNENSSTISEAERITQAPVELTVILKDSERTYRHKFLIYQRLVLHPYSEEIKLCIKEAKESFRAEPEDIIIQAKMVVQ